MVDTTLSGLLYGSLLKHGEAAAFSVYQGETQSSNQSVSEIARLHGIFKTCKITKGECIAIQGSNSPQWAQVLLAVIGYGAIAVPILNEFSPNEVLKILEKSNARLFFSDSAAYSRLPRRSRPPKLLSIFALETFLPLESPDPVICEVLPWKHASFDDAREILRACTNKNEAVAAVIYTAGTCGAPKGVMLSHASLLANLQYARNHIKLEKADPMVASLPPAHIFGAVFELLLGISMGAHITFVTQRMTPTELIKVYATLKPRLILLPPVVLEELYRQHIQPTLNRPLVKLALSIPLLKGRIFRRIAHARFRSFGGNYIELIVGGTMFRSDVEDFFRTAGIRLAVGYGMTECGPLISYAPWNENRPRCAGRAIDDLELRIQPLPPNNEIGEILVRGKQLMLGYYEDPETTEKAIDQSGWLHTGDLGSLDCDGFLRIYGRRANLLSTKPGKSIPAEQIESLFNEKISISQCLVLKRFGLLVALIEPDYEQLDKRGISGAALARMLEQKRIEVNKRLPPYGQVSRIELFEGNFATTPSRKIKRYLYS